MLGCVAFSYVTQATSIGMVGPPSISALGVIAFIALRRAHFQNADMEATMTIQTQKVPEQSQEGLGCMPALTRLFWIFGGTTALIYCLIYMILGKATFAVHLIYILTTVCLVVDRFVDIKYFKGEKMNGEPASLKHWRLYSLLLLVCAGFLLIAAKAFAKLHIL
jgi:hypothetical protein